MKPNFLNKDENYYKENDEDTSTIITNQMAIQLCLSFKFFGLEIVEQKGTLFPSMLFFSLINVILSFVRMLGVIV